MNLKNQELSCLTDPNLLLLGRSRWGRVSPCAGRSSWAAGLAGWGRGLLGGRLGRHGGDGRGRLHVHGGRGRRLGLRLGLRRRRVELGRRHVVARREEYLEGESYWSVR